MARCRIARAQSLAVAGLARGDLVRRRPPYGHHLAASRRRQCRFSGLLLLSGVRGTQVRTDRRPAGRARPADVAPAGASAVGHRRFAHQTVRAEGRGGRRASQPDAGSGRSALLVRTHLGDDLAGGAASAVGCAGVAAAGPALRPSEDHADDSSPAPLGRFRHQAGTGRAVGRVDRSDRSGCRENDVGRRRRRLHEAAVPAARFEAGRDDRRSGCARMRPSETCRPS